MVTDMQSCGKCQQEKVQALQDLCSIREEFFKEALFELKLEVIVR